MLNKLLRQAVIGVAAAIGLMGASAVAAQTTVTFNATGAAQTWVVPAGVNSVDITALGAQGHDAPGNEGGQGGRASGTLAVTPGETLTIYVGGRGMPANGNDVIMGGGFNGGGDGKNNFYGLDAAGGGGGASDVRRGAATLADRVIVAGGGGGSTSNSDSDGGDGGGLVGENGFPAGLGGAGGTQAAGGAQGGGLGVGGSATVASTPWIGGGGGGYYGGGFSSFERGGGGGSSYLGGVTGGTTASGVHSGDGVVTLVYTATPAPVPTLSEWAMILFGTLLAGGAALYVQRRRLIA